MSPAPRSAKPYWLAVPRRAKPFWSVGELATIQIISEIFPGTHNLPKTGPIFRIRTELDSAHQGEENLGARFLIAALQGCPSPPQPTTMLQSPPLNLGLT